MILVVPSPSHLPWELSQLLFTDDLTGIGRLEKIIFFLTTPTTDQAGLRCSSFSPKSRTPSITSSSESISTELRTELRWSIARGFGSETIFPSRRWWPMRRVGLSVISSIFNVPTNLPFLSLGWLDSTSRVPWSSMRTISSCDIFASPGGSFGSDEEWAIVMGMSMKVTFYHIDWSNGTLACSQTKP